MSTPDVHSIRRRVVQAMPSYLLIKQLTHDKLRWERTRYNLEWCVLERWNDKMRDEFLEYMKERL